jgi:M6 family metalloprotease-like protein
MGVHVSDHPAPSVSSVSDRNLLGVSRDAPWSLPCAAPPFTLPDTLSVLMLRVEFQPDNTPLSTGDGTFDMRSQDQFLSEEGHYIDTAPHDANYAYSHLAALDIYYSLQSEERLRIAGTVLPEQDSAAFRLPHQMSYYAPTVDPGHPDYFTQVVEGLDRFTRDAFTLADTSMPSIDFSAFDAYVLFHAGSDQQNNIAILPEDDSPHDLFTGYIRLGEAVAVDDSATAIWDAVMLPETGSQDNRIVAINAVFAHEFGHPLGLVDFYDTRTFISQLGDFALMDNNAADIIFEVQAEGYESVLASGLMPVGLSAFSRAYLGFSTPVELSLGSNVPVDASSLPSGQKLIRVPVSPNEYFLLENRQFGLNAESIALIADDSTGVILGTVDYYTEEFINEYDFVSPVESDSGGLVIYHVDETRAMADDDGDGVSNWWENRLQTIWPEGRFVDIEEADGVQDLDDPYVSYGHHADCFRAGNATAFGPGTVPDSRSAAGGETGVSLTNVSENAGTMTFDLNTISYQAGWEPGRRFAAGALRSPVVADFDGDGACGVLIADARGHLLGLNGDGTPMFDNDVVSYAPVVDGDSVAVDVPAFATVSAPVPLVASPAVGDIDGDGAPDVVVASQDGLVYAYRTVDTDLDGFADPVPGFPVDLGQRAVGGTMLINLTGNSLPEIVVPVDDRLFALDSAGTIVWSAVLSDTASCAPASSGESSPQHIFVGTGSGIELLDADGSVVGVFPTDEPIVGISVGDMFRGGSGGGADDIPVATTDTDVVELLIEGTVLPPDWSLNREPFGSAPPVLADINEDGYLDIVFGGDGFLYAYGRNGALVSDFPRDLDRSDSLDTVSDEALVFDADGDGQIDIVFGTLEGLIRAVDASGGGVPGFPLAVGSNVSSSPAVGDLDGDGDAELVAVSDEGAIVAWDLDVAASEEMFWPTKRRDLARTGWFPTSLLGPVQHDGVLVASGSFYAYPNPVADRTVVRYRLARDADVDITFYDLSGHVVDEMTDEGMGNADNEVEWDATPVAPGVYICRLEATALGASDVCFTKIAVVR